jgi:hypothetical protein
MIKLLSEQIEAIQEHAECDYPLGSVQVKNGQDY